MSSRPPFAPMPNVMSISPAPGLVPMVILKPDGTLEFGPDYKPDEAARIFWEAMRAVFPQHGNPPLSGYSNAELLSELAVRTEDGSNLPPLMQWLRDVTAGQRTAGKDATSRRLQDEAVKLSCERDRLWEALDWIDHFNPEDITAAEAKFGFSLCKRVVYER